MKNLFKAFGVIALILTVHAHVWADWTAVTDNKVGGIHFYGITYGNNKFVAVGGNEMAYLSD
jgi:hypothetical protein